MLFAVSQDLPQAGFPYVDRDISWLDFNERVLEEALNPEVPLLDRLKFLCITASNLEEFFMVRFSSLVRALQRTAGKPEQEKHHSELEQKKQLILFRVQSFLETQAGLFQALTIELAAHGVQFVTDVSSDGGLPQPLEKILKEPFALLSQSPTSVPLKQLPNLGLALMFAQQHAIVPTDMPRILSVRKQSTLFVFLVPEVLRCFSVFEGQTPTEASLIKVVRDADATTDLITEDTESIPDAVHRRVRARDMGHAMLLLVYPASSPILPDTLATTFSLSPQHVLKSGAPSSLAWMKRAIGDLDLSAAQRKVLLYPPIKRHIPKALRKPDGIFKELQQRDYLLHHPYDAFDAYVQFVQAAVDDPSVDFIAQTVYRMDAISPVVDLLKRAAGIGKKVTVLIEPRARFDEVNNVELGKQLAAAGVDVRYASGKLKVHAKIAIVRRIEDGQAHSYTHLSTGNYHAATARQYTDLAILSGHPGIGNEALQVFEAASHGQTPSNLEHLVIAPTRLHRRLLSLIRSETSAAKEGKPAGIFVKVNALVDAEVVGALYEASQAGVKVQLVIRGACSLVPGIPGVSENIRVTSIVDRFLEHSRIYSFTNSNQLYLSSADWMPRNFFHRLEIAFPILDQRIVGFLKNTIIPTYLADTVKARVLFPDGVWYPASSLKDVTPVRAQLLFEELSRRGYTQTSLVYEGDGGYSAVDFTETDDGQISKG